MPDLSEFVTRLRSVPQTAPNLRAERKRISKEVAQWGRVAVLKLAFHLMEARVARFVAYELILNHRPSMERITASEVRKLGEGIKHWGDVDAFCYLISGPAWRAGNISDNMIRVWAGSDDWCWRRAALVSTVPLNSRARGGTGDPKRTLRICAMLRADRDHLVEKALSWALRELAKRNPTSVRAFLATHGCQVAPCVFREVNNKLATGRKSPSHQDVHKTRAGRPNRAV